MKEIKNHFTKLKSEFLELEKKLNSKLEAVQEEKEQLKNKIKVLKTQNVAYENDINKLRKENATEQRKRQQLEKELQELQERMLNLENERTLLLNEKAMAESEKEALSNELERVGAMYQEITGKQAEQKDLSSLLSLYITLMEEVFSGKAAFKTLAIMHGDKEEWTREEIAKSIGVSELELRKVLGELARADLIEYDEETTKCTLKTKISSFDPSEELYQTEG